MAVFQGTLLLKYYWDISLIRVNRDIRAGPGPDLALQGRSTWPHPGYFMTCQIDRTEVAPLIASSGIRATYCGRIDR